MIPCKCKSMESTVPHLARIGTGALLDSISVDVVNEKEGLEKI